MIRVLSDTSSGELLWGNGKKVVGETSLAVILAIRIEASSQIISMPREKT
ncbi:hypothetical protein OAL35_01390 [bacterium]|nr:hypothetical protein [bacterium]